jgi:hypothetical protein
VYAAIYGRRGACHCNFGFFEDQQKAMRRSVSSNFNTEIKTNFNFTHLMEIIKQKSAYFEYYFLLL